LIYSVVLLTAATGEWRGSWFIYLWNSDM